MKDAIRNMMTQELGEYRCAKTIAEMEEISKYYEAYRHGLDWDSLIYEMDYIPTNKKSNKINQLIKDEARFLFGKPPEIKLSANNPECAQSLQHYVDKTLSQNLFQGKLLKAAKDCFIGKRVAIKLCAAKDYVKIMFLPSDSFLFEANEEDIDELNKIVFYYLSQDSDDINKQRIWRQKYEMQNGKCILNEAVFDGTGELVEKHYENYDTGLNFIPAYVIVNDGLSGDLTGESDVADLLSNQQEYNRLVSEDIDTLRKGMNQIIYGTDIDNTAIEHFKIKPGAFWDVPTDPSRAENGNQAAIGTISNDFGYDARIEHALNRIENEMYASLKVPNITPEQLQGFITSGKAMKALYWQLMARCQEKFMDWQPALTWMVWAIIDIGAVMGFLNPLPHLDGLNVRVENRFPLPEDEESQKAIDLSEVSAKVMSRKRYLEKWITKDNSEAMAELLQIDNESSPKSTIDDNDLVDKDKTVIS